MSKKSPSDLATARRATALEVLSCGLRDYAYWVYFEDWAIATRQERKLGKIWAKSAEDGGFRFLGVWEEWDDVLSWCPDGSRWPELREAAVAGGVEGLVRAYFAGVPLHDLGVD